MSGKVEKDALAQHWVHSHEEDTDTEMVFRPASYKFPPSRGRASLELKPDGSLTEGGPGPTDRSEYVEGTWKLDANKNLILDQGPRKHQRSRILELVSADKHRLVIKK